MFVFIMRHGEATTYSAKDVDRELTTYGQEEVASMIERCANNFAMVDEIWASPYIRTQQTAAIASKKINKKIVLCDLLTPTNNPDTVLQALAKIDKTILLVSHQPLVSILVNKLADLEPGRYRMNTAAVACIESELFIAGCGELAWLYQPGN